MYYFYVVTVRIDIVPRTFDGHIEMSVDRDNPKERYDEITYDVGRQIAQSDGFYKPTHTEIVDGWGKVQAVLFYHYEPA